MGVFTALSLSRFWLFFPAEYSSEDPKIILLCCHHFHLGCIYEWKERSDACPICGKVMKIIVIFLRCAFFFGFFSLIIMHYKCIFFFIVYELCVDWMN